MQTAIYDDEEGVVVIITAVDRDEGTLVTFAGVLADRDILVAVGHREARAISQALEGGPVAVLCQPWQLLGYVGPVA